MLMRQMATNCQCMGVLILLLFTILNVILTTTRTTTNVDAKSLPPKFQITRQRDGQRPIQDEQELPNSRKSSAHRPTGTQPEAPASATSSATTTSTTSAYMSDIEYDLRLRQLMEDLVLYSRIDNPHYAVHTLLPMDLKDEYQQRVQGKATTTEATAAASTTTTMTTPQPPSSATTARPKFTTINNKITTNNIKANYQQHQDNKDFVYSSAPATEMLLNDRRNTTTTTTTGPATSLSSASSKDSLLDYVLLEYMTKTKQNLTKILEANTANGNSTMSAMAHTQRIRQQLEFLQKNAEKFKKFQQVEERTKNATAATEWNVIREIEAIQRHEVEATQSDGHVKADVIVESLEMPTNSKKQSVEDFNKTRQKEKQNGIKGNSGSKNSSVNFNEESRKENLPQKLNLTDNFFSMDREHGNDVIDADFLKQGNEISNISLYEKEPEKPPVSMVEAKATETEPDNSSLTKVGGDTKLFKSNNSQLREEIEEFYRHSNTADLLESNVGTEQKKDLESQSKIHLNDSITPTDIWTSTENYTHNQGKAETEATPSVMEVEVTTPHIDVDTVDILIDYLKTWSNPGDISKTTEGQTSESPINQTEVIIKPNTDLLAKVGNHSGLITSAHDFKSMGNNSSTIISEMEINTTSSQVHDRNNIGTLEDVNVITEIYPSNKSDASGIMIPEKEENTTTINNEMYEPHSQKLQGDSPTESSTEQFGIDSDLGTTTDSILSIEAKATETTTIFNSVFQNSSEEGLQFLQGFRSAGENQTELPIQQRNHLRLGTGGIELISAATEPLFKDLDNLDFVAAEMSSTPAEFNNGSLVQFHGDETSLQEKKAAVEGSQNSTTETTTQSEALKDVINRDEIFKKEFSSPPVENATGSPMANEMLLSDDIKSTSETFNEKGSETTTVRLPQDLAMENYFEFETTIDKDITEVTTENSSPSIDLNNMHTTNLRNNTDFITHNETESSLALEAKPIFLRLPQTTGRSTTTATPITELSQKDTTTTTPEDKGDGASYVPMLLPLNEPTDNHSGKQGEDTTILSGLIFQKTSTDESVDYWDSTSKPQTYSKVVTDDLPDIVVITTTQDGVKNKPNISGDMPYPLEKSSTNPSSLNYSSTDSPVTSTDLIEDNGFTNISNDDITTEPDNLIAIETNIKTNQVLNNPELSSISDYKENGKEFELPNQKVVVNDPKNTQYSTNNNQVKIHLEADTIRLNPSFELLGMANKNVNPKHESDKKVQIKSPVTSQSDNSKLSEMPNSLNNNEHEMDLPDAIGFRATEIEQNEQLGLPTQSEDTIFNIVNETVADQVSYDLSARHGGLVEDNYNANASNITLHEDNGDSVESGNLFENVELRTTEQPTTELPTMELSTTELPNSHLLPTMELPTTNMSTMELPTMELPTTQLSTMELPYMELLTTELPTMELTTSDLSTTELPTTKLSTMELLTTELLTTELLTTELPTMELLTTELTTSDWSTTELPSTNLPTMELPTMELPTTKLLTMELITTEVSTMELTTTDFPTTELPTTKLPTMEFLTTELPNSHLPTMELPTTKLSTMELPTTVLPTTELPTMELTTTDFPTTELPTTVLPTTELLITDPPNTEMPIAVLPTTETTYGEMTTIELPKTDNTTTEFSSPSEGIGTEISTSAVPSTNLPTIDHSIIELPTTEIPMRNFLKSRIDLLTLETVTTEIPTTESPIRELPIAQINAKDFPITVLPTKEFLTETPTVKLPTAEQQGIKLPIAKMPTTENITLELSKTDKSSSELATLEILSTQLPTNEMSSTEYLASEVGIINISATEIVTTDLPKLPTTELPSTEGLNTEIPTSQLPTTELPSTEWLNTEMPTSQVPTIELPTNEIPITERPTTDSPTSQVPTTQLPTTVLPTTGQSIYKMQNIEFPTTVSPTRELPNISIPYKEITPTDIQTKKLPIIRTQSIDLPTIQITAMEFSKDPTETGTGEEESATLVSSSIQGKLDGYNKIKSNNTNSQMDALQFSLPNISQAAKDSSPTETHISQSKPGSYEEQQVVHIAADAHVSESNAVSDSDGEAGTGNRAETKVEVPEIRTPAVTVYPFNDLSDKVPVKFVVPHIVYNETSETTTNGYTEGLSSEEEGNNAPTESDYINAQDNTSEGMSVDWKNLPPNDGIDLIQEDQLTEAEQGDAAEPITELVWTTQSMSVYKPKDDHIESTVLKPMKLSSIEDFHLNEEERIRKYYNDSTIESDESELEDFPSSGDFVLSEEERISDNEETEASEHKELPSRDDFKLNDGNLQTEDEEHDGVEAIAGLVWITQSTSVQISTKDPEIDSKIPLVTNMSSPNDTKNLDNFPKSSEVATTKDTSASVGILETKSTSSSDVSKLPEMMVDDLLYRQSTGNVFQTDNSGSEETININMPSTQKMESTTDKSTILESLEFEQEIKNFPKKGGKPKDPAFQISAFKEEDQHVKQYKENTSDHQDAMDDTRESLALAKEPELIRVVPEAKEHLKTAVPEMISSSSEESTAEEQEFFGDPSKEDKTSLSNSNESMMMVDQFDWSKEDLLTVEEDDMEPVAAVPKPELREQEILSASSLEIHQATTEEDKENASSEQEDFSDPSKDSTTNTTQSEMLADSSELEELTIDNNSEELITEEDDDMEPITEIVWLTQSTSIHIPPSDNIDKIASKISMLTQPLTTAAKLEIVKPQDATQSLDELITIIGNSLQKTSGTNKMSQQELNGPTEGQDNINRQQQQQQQQYGKLQENATAIVNCPTTPTMQLTTLPSTTATPSTDTAKEQYDEPEHKMLMVMAETIENQEEGIEKWSTFKNNHLNNESLTKADNDDQMEQITKENANDDAHPPAHGEHKDDDVNNVKDVQHVDGDDDDVGPINDKDIGLETKVEQDMANGTTANNKNSETRVPEGQQQQEDIDDKRNNQTNNGPKTNNEFKISTATSAEAMTTIDDLEGAGINEMSTIETKLVDISKHNNSTDVTIDKEAASEPQPLHLQHEMVNDEEMATAAAAANLKDYTHKGNEETTISQDETEVLNKSTFIVDIANGENVDNHDVESDDKQQQQQQQDYEELLNEQFVRANVVALADVAQEVEQLSSLTDTFLNTQSFPDPTTLHSDSYKTHHSKSNKHNKQHQQQHIPASLVPHAQAKEEITTTNWWHSLPYTEIRKFLNSIFDSVTTSTALAAATGDDDLTLSRSHQPARMASKTSDKITKPTGKRKSEREWSLPHLSKRAFSFDIWSSLL